MRNPEPLYLESFAQSDLRGKKVSTMRIYSFRSKSGLEPDRTDQSIGMFPNRDSALAALNKTIGDEGKTCNNNLAIRNFTFIPSGNTLLCIIEYYLVETFNSNETVHRLFPDNFNFNPYKTTSAAGSFMP